MWRKFTNIFDSCVRKIMKLVTSCLPVKIISDDKGVPFLYRYHILTLYKDGPSLYIHNFVKSDPDRGYHDHPWKYGLSFILCGGYDERIYNKNVASKYITHKRNMWTFNFLNGQRDFHRVMVDEKKNAWTIFAHTSRAKPWGMISLEDKYVAMNSQISDQDSGWWKTVEYGNSLYEHLPLKGNVIATVDIIVVCIKEKKILLIKRGKEPFKDCWAFPGGRINPDDEDIEAAAYRELKEETALTKDTITLIPIKTLGNKTRDPRGFCITSVFMAYVDMINNIKIKAGSDAVNYQWFSIDALPEMAFDHQSILHNANILF